MLPLQTNTFQCAIGVDAQQQITSISFLYPEDSILWTTGDADGGMGGLGGDPADVGFVAPDPTSSLFISISNTPAVVDIESTSNVFVPGLYTFRFEGSSIFEPQLGQ